MANNNNSVEDEDEKFEQWLDDQLTGKYATGELETDLRMAVSTIRGMSKMTPKDFAVQPFMRFIKQREHEAELRGRIDEVSHLDTKRHYGMDYQDSLDELDEYKYKRLAELTASTTNDTATDGWE